MSAVVHVGNVLDILPTLEAGSVNCVVTSPPYWGLRDYGTAQWDGGDAGCDHKQRNARGDNGRPATKVPRGHGGAMIPSGYSEPVDSPIQYRAECAKCGAIRIDSQLGLEPTPELYVANLVAVFRDVRRVLRDDGTLWLNLGDSYAGGGTTGRNDAETIRAVDATSGRRPNAIAYGDNCRGVRTPRPQASGIKPKDLVGIPWRVAFALQADGWYLRSDIIWNKPNPMPESVTDRPTKAHEYVFLLTKQPRYWYDAEAIRESWSDEGRGARNGVRARTRNVGGRDDGYTAPPSTWYRPDGVTGRNRRTVWTIATQPYPEAHFATYPEKLVEPCVMAGCPAQVCSECGAPWAHVVDIDSHPNYTADGQKHDGTYYRPNPGGGVSNDSRTRTDRGWQPTCTCDAPTIPGTVADFFAGSGTTGAVACRLGRNFVGVELSPEYAEMAERRIAPHRDQMQLAVTT